MKKFHLKKADFSARNLLQSSAHVAPLITTILVVFSVVFLGVTVYRYVSFTWDDDTQKAYEREFFGKASFQEERFRSVVQSMENRAKRYQENVTIQRDITQ